MKVKLIKDLSSCKFARCGRTGEERERERERGREGKRERGREGERERGREGEREREGKGSGRGFGLLVGLFF